MILHHLLGGEQHRIYADLSDSNLFRQYGFLQSAAVAAMNVKRLMVSATLVKALNYHAIACLHPNAGEYRPCPVKAGSYEPPEHFHVPEPAGGIARCMNSSNNGTVNAVSPCFGL